MAKFMYKRYGWIVLLILIPTFGIFNNLGLRQMPEQYTQPLPFLETPGVRAATTINLDANYVASSLKINATDIFNTNGYNISVGTGGLTIEGGTFNASAGVGGTSVIVVEGNWNNTDGSFVCGNSQVKFNGASDQFVKSGTSDFNNVEIANTNTVGLGAYLLNDSMNIKGNFTIVANSKFSATNGTHYYNMYVWGNWENHGIFNASNNTVTFNGDGIIDAGGMVNGRFNNLFVGPCVRNITNSNFNVTGNLTIWSGGVLQAGMAGINISTGKSTGDGTYSYVWIYGALRISVTGPVGDIWWFLTPQTSVLLEYYTFPQLIVTGYDLFNKVYLQSIVEGQRWFFYDEEGYSFIFNRVEIHDLNTFPVPFIGATNSIDGGNNQNFDFNNTTMTINGPLDASWAMNSTGNCLTWNIDDPDNRGPRTYTLIIDNQTRYTDNFLDGIDLVVPLNDLRAGTHNVTIITWNGWNSRVRDEVWVTVQNFGPVIDHPADISCNLGGNCGTLLWYVTDNTTEYAHYQIVVDDVVVRSAPCNPEIPILYAPGQLSIGSHNITMIFYDGSGLNIQDSVIITVNETGIPGYDVILLISLIGISTFILSSKKRRNFNK